MIDILNMVFEKKITESEAVSLFDSIVDNFHSGDIDNIPDELNLDVYEWTAICHGISFSLLADWRYCGWPEVCYKCKNKINYRLFGWTIINGRLCHIECGKNCNI